MSSFVESATLKVNDRSSDAIRRINRELASLFRTANRKGAAFKISGLEKAISQVGKLGREMAKLGSMKGIKAGNAFTAQTQGLNALTRSINAYAKAAQRASSVPRIPFQAPPAAGGRQRGGGFQRFAVQGGSGLFGGAISNAAYNTTRAAGSAIAGRSSEIGVLRVLGQSEAAIAALAENAKRASTGMLGVSETSAIAATRNLKYAGVSDKLLPDITRSALKAEAGLAALFDPEDARRRMQTIIKGVDFTGAFNDPKRADDLLRGMAGAQLTLGEDFKIDQFQKALVVSGKAMTLTSQAMGEFAEYVEEGGRPGGQRMQRTNSVLNAQTGVHKNIMGNLIEQGLRTFEGGAVDRKLFDADPFEWGRKHLIPKLEKLGVDINDAGQVQKGLTTILKDRGAVDFFTPAIVKRQNRQQNRDLRKQVDFDRQKENASKDFTLGLKYVSTQFEDLAASLTPIVNKAAPALVSFAEGLDDLAQGKFTSKAIMSGAGSVALGAGALAVGNADKVMLGAAALKLNRAGGKLTTAALALMRAGRGSGLPQLPPPGGGKGGKGSTTVWGRAGGKSKGGRMSRRMKVGGGLGAVSGALALADLASGETDWKTAGKSIGLSIAGGFVGSLVAGPMGGMVGAMFAETLVDKAPSFATGFAAELVRPMSELASNIARAIDNSAVGKWVGKQLSDIQDQSAKERRERAITDTEAKRRQYLTSSPEGYLAEARAEVDRLTKKRDQLQKEVDGQKFAGIFDNGGPLEGLKAEIAALNAAIADAKNPLGVEKPGSGYTTKNLPGSGEAPIPSFRDAVDQINATTTASVAEVQASIATSTKEGGANLGSGAEQGIKNGSNYLLAGIRAALAVPIRVQVESPGRRPDVGTISNDAK